MGGGGGGRLRRWRLSFHKSSSSEKTKKPLDEYTCPISESLMYDPVVVSSGHTFERTCVEVCKTLNFVPVLSDGSKPDFSNLIPNKALKKAIVNWCVSTGYDLPLSAPDCSSVENSVRKLMNQIHDIRDSERDLINGMDEKAKPNLTHAVTQLNPDRRSVVVDYSSSSEESVLANVPETPPLPLVTRPMCYSSTSTGASEVFGDENFETLTLDRFPNVTSAGSSLSSLDNDDELYFVTNLQNVDVFEKEQTVILLRKKTRTDEGARVSLCTPRLLSVLRHCMVSKYGGVQTNAVAALVNLSLEKTNKLKIVRSGIVPILIDVLKGGVAEAREHAAGALFSLALEEENKMAIGVLGALQPLLHAMHSESERTRNDSALALYHLSLVQSNRVKLVKLGACSSLLTMLETSLVGRVLLVLCNLAASSEGKSALLDSNAVECLVRKLTDEKVDSSESVRENVVACLYALSIGSMRFKGLARAARATEVLRKIEENGTERAREKARRMLMMLRERDESEGGLDFGSLLEGGVSQSRYGGNSTQF